MKKHALLALALSAAVLSTSCGGTVTVIVPEEFAKYVEISDYSLGDNENGYKEKTKNEDGSITYVFTQKQHRQLVNKMKTSIDASLTDLDDWEHVSKVTTNEDYSHFTFVADTKELDITDYLMPVEYLTESCVYAVMTGNSAPSISYEFVYAKTGEVLYSNDLSTDPTDETTAPDTTEHPTETPVTQPATQKPTQPQTEATTESSAEASESGEDTYEHNAYYDIVEAQSYTNSIGRLIVIHKVLAKKDVTVDASLTAYGSDGAVIGKSSDTITLTEGQYNYFRYSFDSDVSSAEILSQAKTKRDNILSEERDAVEMVQYNRSGDDLYITFRQTKDKLGSFSKFKLLFYKNDRIVGTEDGFFSISAPNLAGKDTTDVATVWVFGEDFDRVEYMFEP